MTGEQHVCKVMVVDDDLEILDVVRAMLTFDGYQSIVVNTAIGLAKLIKSEQPDVILMDLFMPSITGDTAVAVLRSRGIDVPIIVYTAGNPDHPPEDGDYWNDRSLENWAKKLGATAFVKKPFDMHVLLALIGSFCPSSATHKPMSRLKPPEIVL